jgi:hypothetical protein
MAQITPKAMVPTDIETPQIHAAWVISDILTTSDVEIECMNSLSYVETERFQLCFISKPIDFGVLHVCEQHMRYLFKRVFRIAAWKDHQHFLNAWVSRQFGQQLLRRHILGIGKWKFYQVHDWRFATSWFSHFLGCP